MFASVSVSIPRDGATPVSPGAALPTKRSAWWMASVWPGLCSLRIEAVVVLREHLADFAAQQRQNPNHDDRDQHENERVLDQSLAVLVSEETAKHGEPPYKRLHSLSILCYPLHGVPSRCGL